MINTAIWQINLTKVQSHEVGYFQTVPAKTLISIIP